MSDDGASSPINPMVLGLDRTIVRVVPYQPAWAALFVAEAARLRAALGERVLAIEHVGSTSVPGLAAKPILDLAASVPSLAGAIDLVPDLQRLGYEHKADPELPERLYFVKGTPEHRTHHLSLAEPGSRFWRQHLLFRDVLRANPALAAEYARLKHDLAARHSTDRLAYGAGKKAFIDSVIEQAEKGLAG